MRSGHGHAAVLRVGGVAIATGVSARAVGAGTRTRDVGDQVRHLVAVSDQAELAAALFVLHATFDIARSLRLQAGQAIGTEALVKRGRAEGGAGGHDGAPVGCEAVGIGGAAGGVAAELAVVIAAGVELQGVRATAQGIAQRQRVLRALGDHRHGAGVVEAVFAALERQRQLTAAQRQVVLPEVAGHGSVGHIRRRDRLVTVFAAGNAQLGGVGIAPFGRPVQAQGLHFRPTVVVVPGRETVVLGIHVAVEQAGVQAVHGIELPAQAARHRGAAVAIAVGVAVGLGVEAVAGLARSAQGVIDFALLAAEGRADLARAMAAHTRFNAG